MSDQNRSQSTSEEHVTEDALADTERVDTSSGRTMIGSSEEDVTTAARNAPNFERLPTLPTGEVIDCKNTLRSFAGRRDPPASVPLEFEPEIQVHPTLPDGQIITGKNMLQSFDMERDVDQRTPVDPPDEVTDDAKRSSTEEPPNSMVATSPPPTETVVAVAVESDLIYAEVVREPVAPSVAPDRLENHNAPVAPIPHHNTRPAPPM
jgi:hypothetical protein